MPEPKTVKLLYVLFVALSIGCAPRTSAIAGPSADRSPAGISEASVRAHVEFLASDALNGRGSGTRDEWIAAAYVASQLRQWGLQPMGDHGGYVQTIDVERPELAAAPVLTIGGRRYVHGKEITVAGMASPSIAGTITSLKPGQPVADGSVVLIPAITRDNAAALGGAAIVLTGSGGCGARGPAGPLPRVSPRVSGVRAGDLRPTCVALDREAYAAAEKLSSGSRVTLEAPVKSVVKTNTWNAVGRLEGSDRVRRDEVILLSAHIDHLGTGRPSPGSGQAAAAGGDTIYNGADDDATGSVAVLELARALATGPRPKRTIVFAWFGSEETGGQGSRYFADKPVVPLDRVVANLQFEMIGRPDPKVAAHTLWLTGFERSNLGPELAKRGARLVQDPHPEEQFFMRSDNYQFARRGVVAHTVSSYGLHRDYHQPSDEIDTIDFAHMTDAIRSMVEPIRWLVNAPFKPEWRPGKKP